LETQIEEDSENCNNSGELEAEAGNQDMENCQPELESISACMDCEEAEWQARWVESEYY
jgi:hypothetical protein